MSRVGKTIIAIPQGTQVTLDGQQVTAAGKLGSLTYRLPHDIELTKEGESLQLQPRHLSRRSRSLWGTARARVANIVEGVSNGFRLFIVVEGVGYRAQKKGNDLVIQAGYSHDVVMTPPEGVTVECPSVNEIEVFGSDKQLVGQFAALICKVRPPEPYKGKGIRLKERVILRKEGKKK